MEKDFNEHKAQILEDIKSGKPLFGKDGALAPMIEPYLIVKLLFKSSGFLPDTHVSFLKNVILHL